MFRKKCFVCGKKFFRYILTYTTIDTETNKTRKIKACIECSVTPEGRKKIMDEMTKNTVELENEREKR